MFLLIYLFTRLVARTYIMAYFWTKHFCCELLTPEMAFGTSICVHHTLCSALAEKNKKIYA